MFRANLSRCDFASKGQRHRNLGGNLESPKLGVELGHHFASGRMSESQHTHFSQNARRAFPRLAQDVGAEQSI